MRETRSTSTTLRVVLCSGALLAGTAGCNRTHPVDDPTLTTQVQQRLAADTAISTEPVQVSARAGVITLTGAVSNTAARTLVANDAAGVEGVQQVINDMTVAVASVTTGAVLPAPVTREPERTPAARRTERQQTHPPAPAPITRTAALPPPPTAVPPSTGQTSPPAPPPAPAPPVARVVTLPAGSTLPVRITQTLDSATTQPGDTFSGALTSDIVQDGMVLASRGTGVNGRVTEVHEAGHFKGASLLSVELTGITARGERIGISTQPYSVEGKGRGKNTAVKTGVGAAAGAVLGGIFGGGKGAAIGAAAGGGTGAAINGVTRGEQVQIPSESVVRFVTTSSITVRTSMHAGESPGNPALQPRY